MIATPLEDSTGKKRQVPVFVDEEGTYVVDDYIKYNYKTRKGIISGVVTQQGEGYIHGETIKKVEDNIYISSARYTTCNLEHPHFYIKATKLKVIPKDKIVSGPFYMSVSEVPTPLGFFLGFFPIPEKHKSGVIFPTAGSSDRGFFLREGGYYWAVSDYLGVRLIGDAYANGSYRANLNADYIKKYAYRGSFSISHSQTKLGFEENEDFNTDINVRWNHATQRRRGGNLTANVNAGSSSYYKRNSYNPTAYQTGVFRSTIIYYKAFTRIPFTLNVALGHDQNVTTRTMSFTVPDVTLSSNRIYPFKGKNSIGRNWYENIYFNYVLNTKMLLTNDSIKLRTETTLPFKGENLPFLLSKAQYGAKHSIPVGTVVKFRKTFLKNFNFNPLFNYEEYWNPYKLNYTWNNDDSTVTTDTLRGFYRTSSYSGTVSMSTTIYGKFKIRNGKFAVRHIMIPNIAYSYKPDFTEGNFQNVQTDEFGNTRLLPVFSGSVYGSPSQGKISSLSFSLNNMFEAKVASKSDTIEPKKFKILEQLSFSGGYNFAAKTHKLSVINASARTTLLKRINIFGSATLDPYAFLDSTGTQTSNLGKQYAYRSNVFTVDAGQGLFRLTNYQLSISSNFNPKAKKVYQSNKGNPMELAHINAYPFLYVDFNVPWSLNVSYNINYFKPGIANPTITQSVTFTGDVKLTEKWKVAFNSGFDFVRNEFTLTRFDIHRDLHCWQMAMNIVPFGPIRSYSFTISAKSTILQDLKLNKRSSGFYGNFY